MKTDFLQSISSFIAETGRNTFFNLNSGNNLKPGQPAFLGVPADTLITELPGASGAPAALRRASASVGRFKVSNNHIASELLSGAADLGDLRVCRDNPEKTLTALYQVTREILNFGALPLTVGGDHSLTYSCVRAAAERFPNLQLIHIDAHYDATNPAEHRCRINHGTYIRNLVDDDIIPGNRIFQIGMRDRQWSESGYKYILDNKVWILPMKGFSISGAASLLSELRKHQELPIYVSVDIDSVDPAFAPGAGEHMPGGFYSREIISLLEDIFSGEFSVIGGDLVEVNPILDPDGRTCSLAAELLAIMAEGMIKGK